MSTIRIPAPLRQLTKGEAEISVVAETVAQAVDMLNAKYPGIKERIFDQSGQLHKFINIYVNGEDIRFLDNVETKIAEGDEISIIPAIAGGASVKKKFYLTFPKDRIKDPVIYWLGHKFQIITNIRSASVSDEIGLMALEMEGEEEEINKGVAYLRELGVRVEPIVMDVVE